MSDLTDLLEREQHIVSELSEVRRAIKELSGPELGKLPNSRAGFYHIHSNSYECGMAYWQDLGDYDHPNRGEYRPCKKLVNHKGLCGYEDNSAF